MPDQPQHRSFPAQAAISDKAGVIPAPRPMGLVLRIARLQDVGRARDHQEDAANVITPGDSVVLSRRGQMLVVADGMGGHNAGEIASSAAVAELQRTYFQLSASDDMATNLRQAVASANLVVHRIAQADAARSGMGTTAAVAVVRNQEVHIANVGDSRVYLIRNGQISQITQDHSYVEEQVRLGVLTPEQARTHPQRNIITRALGSGPTVEVDLFNGLLQEGDTLVLCSDGLTGHVTDAEIMQIARDNPPELATRRLVDLANERGGSDNISVIVARLEASAPAPVGKPQKTGFRLPPVAWAAILAVALLIIIGGAILSLTRSGSPTEEQAQTTVSFTPTVPAIVSAVVSPALMSTAALSALASASPTTSEPTATLRPTDTATSTTTPHPTLPAAPTVAATRATPAPANLIAPAVLGPNDGDSPQDSILFKWSPVAGARGYQVETRSDRPGQEAWRSWPVAAAQTELRLVYDDHSDYFQVPATVYFWRMAAVDARGNPGLYSFERRFVFQRQGEPRPSPAPTRIPTKMPTLVPTKQPTPKG